MRCRDLMKSDVVSLKTTDPVYRAAETMANGKVGFAPVLDAMRRLVGVVTDRDLATRVIARRLDYHTPIEEVMTSPVLSCKALDSLEKAGDVMDRSHKRRLPVIDDFGECVGIISKTDIEAAAHLPPIAAQAHEARPPSLH